MSSAYADRPVIAKRRGGLMSRAVTTVPHSKLQHMQQPKYCICPIPFAPRFLPSFRRGWRLSVRTATDRETR